VFDDLVRSYNRLDAEVGAMMPSGEAMPVTGTATYDGLARMEIGTTGTTRLLGEAQVVADFAAGTLDGSLRDFVGVVDGAPAAVLDGVITFDDGVIGVTGADTLRIDVAGALTSADHTVEIEGYLAGGFRRDGNDPAAGLSAVNEEVTTFAVDGVLHDGTLGIVAVR
jgi:hypothetical protein